MSTGLLLILFKLLPLSAALATIEPFAVINLRLPPFVALIWLVVKQFLPIVLLYFTALL